MFHPLTAISILLKARMMPCPDKFSVSLDAVIKHKTYSRNSLTALGVATSQAGNS
jgi:hypothetical protein